MATRTEASESIEQALHGYSGGHSLLASSVELSSLAQRSLNIMSDLSGVSMVEGFRSYVSGYPLPDSDYFIFAKTWYADEMERPGCVWTHSLLIPKQVLGDMKGILSLVSYFVRPDRKVGFQEYKKTLDPVGKLGSERKSRATAKGTISHPATTIQTEILEKLYGRPDSPVFVVTEDGSEFEEFVLRIWQQQWFGLRNRFSFCTGSLSNRKLDGKSMDLQFVPWSIAQEIRWKYPEALVSDLTEQRAHNPDSWITKVLRDLESPNENVRALMQKVGPDIEEARNLFKSLFEFSNGFVEGEVNPLLLRDVIAQMKDEGAKTTAYEMLLKLSPKRNNHLRAEILISACKTLVLTEKSLNRKVISEALEVLYQDSSERNRFLSEILSSRRAAVDDDFLRAIISKLDSEFLLEFIRNDSNVVESILAIRPDLVFNEVLWRVSAEFKTKLWNSISGSIVSLGLDFQISLLGVLLNLQEMDYVESVSDILAEKAVPEILGWLSNNNDVRYYSQSGEWTERLLAIVVKFPSDALQWCGNAKSRGEIAIALEVLQHVNVSEKAMKLITLEDWNKYLEGAETVFGTQRLDFYAFVLAGSLTGKVSAPAKLTAKTFAKVHEAMGKDQLSERAWGYLANIATPLKDELWWDKCQGLRLALVREAEKQNWDFEIILKGLKGYDSIVKKVLFDSRKTKSGKGILKSLKSKFKRKNR